MVDFERDSSWLMSIATDALEEIIVYDSVNYYFVW